MPETSTLFEYCATFDPGGNFEAFLRQVPARWVVYLLADSEDRPVQLLCVKNLRSSLKRRLGGEEMVGPSRRVNYRELIRHIHWRRVDSAFEADWLYYEATRVIFPQTYQGIIGFRPAWFVHVNPDAPFPRYVKTTDLSKPGLFLGPLEDKHAAGALIELAEDSFDLCRYHNLLVQAPEAKACAYKEMGRCPAPCDGSVSMEQYRGLIEWSARSLIHPAPLVHEHDRRMRQAAAELRFESARKIKQLIDQLAQLGKGPYRHVGLLRDFGYLSLQHGPGEGKVKVFLTTAGGIEELAGLIGEPVNPVELLRVALERAAGRQGGPIDLAGAERIGIITHHLFSPKHRGVFLRLDSIDETMVVKACKELKKQARPEEVEVEGEGVMKELQSLEPAEGVAAADGNIQPPAA